MAHRQLPMIWQAFHLPKRGNTADEYEDAFAANVEAGRFGIADGASESSFAGLWARLLVEGFSNGDAKRHSPGGWLPALQQHWSSTVDPLSLPWYAEIKRAEGAFATFVGLSVRQRGRGRGTWHALAVGDSCLFQIRGDRLVAAFPIFRAEDFGTRPCLLGSRPAGEKETRRQGDKETRRQGGCDISVSSSLPVSLSPYLLLRRRGQWLAGDCFLLTTDALAQWFLQQTEKGGKPWQVLEPSVRAGPADLTRRHGDKETGRQGDCAISASRSHCLPVSLSASAPAAADFADWVERLRDQGDLRNDDVTLLVIQM